MLRKARNEDISRIAEIIVFTKRKTYRDIFKNDNVSFNIIQVLTEAEKYNAKGALDNIFVYDDGIVKAVITVQEHPDKVELSDFYVDPFFQNTGIGTQIVDSIKEKVKAKNKKVCLMVLDKNLSAIKFYENQGFKYTGNKHEYEKSGFYLLLYEFYLANFER